MKNRGTGKRAKSVRAGFRQRLTGGRTFVPQSTGPAICPAWLPTRAQSGAVLGRFPDRRDSLGQRNTLGCPAPVLSKQVAFGRHLRVAEVHTAGTNVAHRQVPQSMARARCRPLVARQGLRRRARPIRRTGAEARGEGRRETGGRRHVAALWGHARLGCGCRVAGKCVGAGSRRRPAAACGLKWQVALVVSLSDRNSRKAVT